MTANSILLFGGSGQLGAALRRIGGTLINAPSRSDVDITNPRAIAAAFGSFRPSLVINTAAISDVDGLEKQPDLARLVNFDAPALLATHCAAGDIPLIHVSTDYVFDGLKNAPYQVDDQMNPVNVYGESKMMAEEAIRQTFPWHLIVRTSSLFGSEKYAANFLGRIVDILKKSRASMAPARFVNDQIACPTPVDALAMGLLDMADAIQHGNSGCFGTFHFCGTPPCTRYEFSMAVAEEMRAQGIAVPFPVPAKSGDFAAYAKRPPVVVLDCKRTSDIFGVVQPDWRTDLAKAIASLLAEQS